MKLFKTISLPRFIKWFAVAACLLSLTKAGTYTTTFGLTENPISEGSRWINGAATGLDWKNVRTTPGLAFGTQTGSGGGFDDSTAVLTGTWGANQTVIVTIFATGADTASGSEAEIRLRTTITAHSITGYECLVSCIHSNPYFAIVRWNGTLNNFTVLQQSGMTALTTGDQIKATIIGTLITMYVSTNGGASFTPILNATATDATYSSGAPGQGFWIDTSSGTGGNNHFGLSSFSATGSDTTAPTLSSATINAAGTLLTLAFNSTVYIASGGNTGWTISLSGGASTLTYVSGSGTSSLVYSLSRFPHTGETGTVSYTNPGEGIENTTGNDLATITNSTVTNNSAQSGVTTLPGNPRRAAALEAGRF